MPRILVLLLMVSGVNLAGGAQRPASPPPPGNRIVAQDGDLVVVENDARVRVMFRREANVRVVFDADERSILLLVDHATPSVPADGRVDWYYRYGDLTGAWPFEARWEGAATIEEYGRMRPGPLMGGLGIVTPQGLVQIIGPEQEFHDQSAVTVLSYGSGGSGGINKLEFDEAERWASARARRSDGAQSPGASGVSGTLSFGVEVGAGAAGAGSYTSAVRAGRDVRPPKKIRDVRPAIPDDAARARIRGIVILEITVDVDGAVKDPRVLRSIPMLDAAALDAVRQWRYEPPAAGTPVIMTVSVSFE
jgi:TonB family protein